MKTKLLSCILLSAMALGATQAFAQKLDAPIAAKEDLLTFAGVEYEVSVDDKGETTYTILDSSKEGAQEIYEAAISENNRRIEQVWEENALSKFAEKKKLSIDFENAKYGLVQFNCKLTGITVDELAKKPFPSLPKRKNCRLISRTRSTVWCSLTASSPASQWTSWRKS